MSKQLKKTKLSKLKIGDLFVFKTEYRGDNTKLSSIYKLTDKRNKDGYFITKQNGNTPHSQVEFPPSFRNRIVVLINP